MNRDRSTLTYLERADLESRKNHPYYRNDAEYERMSQAWDDHDDEAFDRNEREARERLEREWWEERERRAQPTKKEEV